MSDENDDKLLDEDIGDEEYDLGEGEEEALLADDYEEGFDQNDDHIEQEEPEDVLDLEAGLDDLDADLQDGGYDQSSAPIQQDKDLAYHRQNSREYAVPDNPDCSQSQEFDSTQEISYQEGDHSTTEQVEEEEEEEEEQDEEESRGRFRSERNSALSLKSSSSRQSYGHIPDTLDQIITDEPPRGINGRGRIHRGNWGRNQRGRGMPLRGGNVQFRGGLLNRPPSHLGPMRGRGPHSMMRGQWAGPQRPHFHHGPSGPAPRHMGPPLMNHGRPPSMGLHQVGSAHQLVNIQQMGPPHHGAPQLGLQPGHPQLGLPQMGPQHMGAQHMGAQHMGPQHVGPQHMGPQYMGPQHMGPPQMGPQHMGPSQMGPQHLRPSQMCPPQINSLQINPNHHGMPQRGPNMALNQDMGRSNSPFSRPPDNQQQHQYVKHLQHQQAPQIPLSLLSQDDNCQQNISFHDQPSIQRVIFNPQASTQQQEPTIIRLPPEEPLQRPGPMPTPTKIHINPHFRGNVQTGPETRLVWGQTTEGLAFQQGNPSVPTNFHEQPPSHGSYTPHRDIGYPPQQRESSAMDASPNWNIQAFSTPQNFSPPYNQGPGMNFPNREVHNESMFLVQSPDMSTPPMYPNHTEQLPPQQMGTFSSPNLRNRGADLQQQHPQRFQNFRGYGVTRGQGRGRPGNDHMNKGARASGPIPAAGQGSGSFRSPPKRPMQDASPNSGIPVKQLRYDPKRKMQLQNSNLHEVQTVDTLPDTTTTVETQQEDENEDEETREYRKKIEEQKRLREKVLREKEERRKRAALLKQKGLEVHAGGDSVTDKKEVHIVEASPSTQVQPILTIVNRQQGSPVPQAQQPSPQHVQKRFQHRIHKTVQPPRDLQQHQQHSLQQHGQLQNQPQLQIQHQVEHQQQLIPCIGSGTRGVARGRGAGGRNVHQRLGRGGGMTGGGTTGNHSTELATKVIQTGGVRKVVNPSAPSTPAPAGRGGVVQRGGRLVVMRGGTSPKGKLKAASALEVRKVISPNPCSTSAASTADVAGGTKTVAVENLANVTSEKQLSMMCNCVGKVESLNLDQQTKRAIIRFAESASASAFVKRYQRKMVDLSLIKVSLIDD